MFIHQYFIVLLCICFLSCAQPQNKTSIEISPNDSLINIATVKKELNLNGPVKYFKGFYNKDIYKQPKDSLELLDFSNSGYFHFNKSGLEKKFVWPLVSDTLSMDKLKIFKGLKATEYFYKKNDILFKSRINQTLNIPYPIKNPYLLKLNVRRIYPYNLEIRKDSSTYFSLTQYDYDVNERGNPISEKEYVGEDFDNSGYLDNNERKRLVATTEYEYDEFDRIISKSFTINFKGLGSDIVDNEFPASEDLDQIFEFTYNNEGRVKTYTLKIGGVFCKRELYTYLPNGELKTRELFIEPSRTILRYFPRNHIVQHFDGYGNIIEATNYDGQGNIYNHRIYKYEYDKYHNWTRCEMYFTGNTSDPPTLVAERIIEYYE